MIGRYKERVANFGAGPSALPYEVLKTAQESLLNWNNAGMSVIEMSHRGREFLYILNETKEQLRSLLGIPPNYKILFMQGGGTGQFAAVPLNLLPNKEAKADYLITGVWSKKAFEEARKFGNVSILATSEKDGFTRIPDTSRWTPSSDAQYLYFCQNETINGVEFHSTPKHPSGLLVSDASSNFLSKPLNVEDYGILYAGAQKNAGMAGLTVVIAKEEILRRVSRPEIPTILHYQKNADADSTLNTPPTFAVYLSGLVFKWVADNGGLAEMERRAIQKSTMLYDVIDSSEGFYCNSIQKESRSRMNVVFRIKGGEEMEKLFVKQAEEKGLVGLQGHRSVGGLRASLYNAVSIEDTERLVDFMREFKEQHGHA